MHSWFIVDPSLAQSLHTVFFMFAEVYPKHGTFAVNRKDCHEPCPYPSIFAKRIRCADMAI